MIKQWNLQGLSYENVVEITNEQDYMPVEPPYDDGLISAR